MKLLLDENLSYRLIGALERTFPGITHLCMIQLQRASDLDVWSHARAHDLIIVTKDDDFRQYAFLHGHPPKVIWLKVGNVSTQTILRLMQNHVADIVRFGSDPDSSLLILSLQNKPVM